MTSAPRHRVVIVARSVPHYRVPFYDGLRAALAAQGTDLSLVYGVGAAGFPERQDRGDVDWGIPVPSWQADLGPARLVWQRGLAQVRDADLVVAPQQTQFLMNYVLLARQLLGRVRLALWGHGRNFQTWRASSTGEVVKRWLSRQPHWWFAYNELAAQAVADLGYPPERITVVQNAIDTRSLVGMHAALDGEQLQAARARFGIDRDRHGHVAVYAGGLYRDKRLDVLLAACERVRQQVPDFEVIVIGAGADQPLVEAAAARHPWLHYVGPQFGHDKVVLFGLARLLLMPGLVGLAVLDAFALETPLVTLADSPHSPEIDYLVDGDNGVVVDPGDAGGDAVEAYAATVSRLLQDEDARQRLVAGCRRARDTYTIEEMVRRFADGVQAALAAPARFRRGTAVVMRRPA